MPSNYIRLVEQRARQQLEQLNQAQQRAIIEAYNSAGKELVRQYRGAKDGTATKALYASYTKKLYDETNEIIQQYAIKGAQVAPSVEKLVMQKAFQMAGLDTSLANDKFDNIIGKLGMESVKNIIGGGIYKDGAGLSSRIWQSSMGSSNKIQEIIAAGLAQDMGAAKLSELLRAYVDPTVRKTWDTDKIRSILGDGYAAWNKNLEYNALRLARTTLSHTATMSMRQARQVNPYATKIKWHSVHAAGRTCETCEEMDGQVFDTEECPFDHPNGMCYQTHEMEKSLDEIADELAAWCNGEENEMLDKWWKEIGGPDEKPSFAGVLNIMGKQVPVDEIMKKASLDDPDEAYEMLTNVIPFEKVEACMNPDDTFDLAKLRKLLNEYSSSPTGKPTTQVTTMSATVRPSSKTAAPKPAAKPAPSTAATGRSKYAQKAGSVYQGQQTQISEFFDSQSGWRKRGLDMLGDTQVKSVVGARQTSFYRPSDGTVFMKTGTSHVPGDGKYRALLHESGHAVDYKLGVFSKSREFKSAMSKDFAVLSSRNRIQLQQEISKLPAGQAQGVQDMLSSIGVTAINRDGVVIHHTSEYWKSSSDLQGAELFAHIYEASATPGAEQVMQKYFPNAFGAVVKKLGG